jgi:NitT/TauT family transport system permease protein
VKLSQSPAALKAAPWIFTIGFFLLWELACRGLKVATYKLPAPSDIAVASVTYSSQLIFHSAHTLWMTLAGFLLSVVLGAALGVALGASRFLHAGTYPLLVGFNAIPKVAAVPILVFWFGVGWVPPVVTACIISFFPILVNVATGLATIEPEVEDVLRALGASTFDIVRKVGIPRSLPYFFASLKVAITLAYVGSVIAEYNASNYGIGNLMARASADFNVPLVWASLLALGVMGVVLYAATAVVERRMTRWAQRSNFAA